jgi:hypothetical protein
MRKIAALSVMLLLSCLFALPAQAQTSCSNGSLDGTYFYQVDGPVLTGASVSPYVELGKFIADGNGAITSGQSTTSTNGTVTPWTFTGTYVVHGDCTGTLSLSFNNSTAGQLYPFDLADGGRDGVIIFSTPNNVIGGHIYRAASRGASQCGETSVTGGYSYLLGGVMPGPSGKVYYSNAGQVVSDGSGHLTSNGVANVGTGAQPLSGNGSYSIGTDCSGTAQLTNANGTSNYRVAVVEGGTVLFLETDTGATVAGAMQPQLTPLVLPQFVFGGGSPGFYTALYFTNSTKTAVSFTVNFTSDDGTPLNVPALGGASTTVNVPALGTAIVEAPNAGELSEGYATVTLPPGVSGYGVFRQSVNGRPDQEAVVPFAAANATSSTLAYDDTAFTTSVAIANPGPVAAAITITAWDNAGNQVGTAPMYIPPYHKTEGKLYTIYNLSAIVGLRGRVQFSATAGSVAVLGLRFGAAAFTSIPTTQP